MEDYIGKTCPYCKTLIQEGDDVQVCPECGIAHHKGCWDENLGCTTFGCAGHHGHAKANALTCENCGAAVESTQKFCPKCGRPLPAQPAPAATLPQKTCPVCGTSNDAANKFCVRCSAALAVPPAAPSVPETSAPPAAPAAPVPPAAPTFAAAPAAPAYAAPAAPSVPGGFTAAPSAPAAPAKKRGAKLPKLIASVLGMLSGLLSVILGFVTYGMSAGSYESSHSYGGDAYTGIQNAAAQGANNVLYGSEILRFGFGSLLLVLGLALIAFFAYKTVKELEAAKKL